MEVDARKMACPAPVLMTKEAIESKHPGRIEIIVDNEAAKQNVVRFLQSRSYGVEVRDDQPDFRITGMRSGENDSEEKEETAPAAAVASRKKIMVMIATDRIGFGDDELGLKLMINFIKTLKEMHDELWKLVFVNNGVKLAVQESSVVPDLKELIDNGTEILVCGTCLTHFDLLDKKAVGETTNMLDIVTAMQVADKVINI